MTQQSNSKHAAKIIVHVDSEIEDLVPGFLENRHKDIDILQESLAKDDYGTIRRMGHTMKGVGGGYGFDAITDIGQSLEQAAKDKNPEEIQRWVKELSNYLERVEVVYE